MQTIQSIAQHVAHASDVAFTDSLFCTCLPLTWIDFTDEPDGSHRILVRRDSLKRDRGFITDADRAEMAALIPCMGRDLIEPAPALDIDARLFAPGSRYVMTSRHMGERLVVWNFLRHMSRNGWKCSAVHDGESNVPVLTPRDAMELVFNLDESRLRFRKAEGKVHVVCIVLGNSPWEVIADYSAPHDRSEGFEDTVNAFVPEYLFPEYVN